MAIKIGDRVRVNIEGLTEEVTGVVTYIAGEEEIACANAITEAFFGKDLAEESSDWNIGVDYDVVVDGVLGGTFAERELEVLV